MPEWENRLTFDVGVDVWGYAPIPWEVIIEKMARKLPRDKCSDGEKSPRGVYSQDPDQRVLDTRAKNLELMKEMGIEILHKEAA
jgi:hypothetical protein